MRQVWSVRQIRDAEAATGDLLRSGALMQRAASGLAAVLLSELRSVDAARTVARARGDRPERSRGRVRGGRVLLAVGSGNNGGDALWAGVRLLGRGVRVTAWRTDSSVHDEGWQAFRAAGGRAVDAVGAIGMLADTDLVVDGVLGIGGRGGLREPVATFADACSDVGVRVVAVDLPSGLEADSSVTFSSFRADVTVSFGGLKACLVAQPAASACGVVRVIDIGLDLAATGEPALWAWEPSDVAAHWPLPGPIADKYSRGVLGVDTGSETYPGAAVLSVSAAVHAGAGMVRYLGGATDAVVSALPNVVTASGRVQAHLVGSGWGARERGPEVLGRVLEAGLPTVVDADAIGMLPTGRLGANVLLTPHAGELARLLGVERSAVEADPVGHAMAASIRTGATILLKGATQYVVEPSGRTTLAVPGPAWTAQAGSGDCLAGVCGALLAAGLPVREAALTAASVQAIAASRHPGPRPPQDLIALLPDVVAALVGSPSCPDDKGDYANRRP